MAVNRTYEIFKHDLALILKLYPGLNRTTLYSLIYKISDDIAGRQKSSRYPPDIYHDRFEPQPFWTVNALDHYTAEKSNWMISSDKPLKGTFDKIFDSLHLEHVIPRKVIINWLIDGDANNRNVNIRIGRAMDLLVTTCWVTRKSSDQNSKPSEQSALDTNKYDLKTKDSGNIKSSMPKGWEVATGDIWARYDAVRKQNEDLDIKHFLEVVLPQNPK